MHHFCLLDYFWTAHQKLRDGPMTKTSGRLQLIIILTIPLGELIGSRCDGGGLSLGRRLLLLEKSHCLKGDWTRNRRSCSWCTGEVKWVPEHFRYTDRCCRCWCSQRSHCFRVIRCSQKTFFSLCLFRMRNEKWSGAC